MRSERAYLAQVEVIANKYRPMYALTAGPTAEVHYGLRVAEMCGLPPEILSLARQFSQQVR